MRRPKVEQAAKPATTETTAAAEQAAEADVAEGTRRQDAATKWLQHTLEKYDGTPTEERTEAVRMGVTSAREDLASADRVLAKARETLARARDAHRAATRAEKLAKYGAAKEALRKVPAAIEQLAAAVAEHERALVAAVVEVAATVDQAGATYAEAEQLAGDLQMGADFARNVTAVSVSDARDRVRAVLARLRAEEERPPVHAWLEPPPGHWTQDGVSSEQIAAADLWRARQDEGAANLERQRQIAVEQDYVRLRREQNDRDATARKQKTTTTEPNGGAA